MSGAMKLLNKINELNVRLSNDVFGERFHVIYHTCNNHQVKLIYADCNIPEELWDYDYVSTSYFGYADEDYQIDRMMFRASMGMNRTIANSDFWEEWRLGKKGHKYDKESDETR